VSASTGPLGAPAPRWIARPATLWRLGFAIVVGLGALALGRVASGLHTPLAGGLMVLGLGLAAVAAYILWRDASSGILLWLTASLIGAVSTGSGVLQYDRLAFLALVAAWLTEVATGRRSVTKPGWVEALMLGFLIVTIASAIASHQLPALSSDVPPHYARPISMVNTIQEAVLFPFAMFYLARQLLTERARIVRLMWFLTAVGLYMGLTNVFTELGPNSLVFPRDILNPAAGLVTPGQGRARGIFLNGAPTGASIVLAFVAATFLATERSVRGRRLALATLPVMLVGVYYTHTRAPIVSMLVVLIFMAALWRGARRWFALTLAVLAVLAALNLGNLTSSDRTKGGVGSSLEVQDRLNIAATGLWAVEQKPLFGWGLGRYGELNTDFHRTWGGTPWIRGYGDIGHNTELAIAVELGLAGLAVWLAILVAIAVSVRRAARRLPSAGVVSRRLALGFWCAGLAWLINEGLIDMRLFPFVNAVIFVWAGMVVGAAERLPAEAQEPAAPATLPAPAGTPA
jgi:O-antigen ligase